jgi:hypothetical protein
MKKFAVGVVLLAALGAACAKAGSDGPVPDANENGMKAASAAAAESYVGSLEQLAVGSIPNGGNNNTPSETRGGEDTVTDLTPNGGNNNTPSETRGGEDT